MAALAPERGERLSMTATLRLMLEAGCMPVHALPYTGEWGEVDSAGDLGCYA